MLLFRKVYTVIGLVIFIIGFGLTPFLSFFIKDMPDIEGIEIIYMLFVTNTAVSYFFSYKRNLILADQNRHIETIYIYSFYILMNILQIIYLFISHDYFGYLIIQVILTIISNWALSVKADKMYPFLKEKNVKKLDKKDTQEIIKNTKALMLKKVGGVAVNSTDNLVISKFVSLEAVGFYSNYYLVIYALYMIINQIYTSLTPGVGNFWVDQEEKRRIELFKKANLATFWIAFFCSICLMVLFNDFIEIIAGKEYVFNMGIVVVLVTIFYFTVMRKVVVSFREAGGIFYKDRYITVYEAIANISISIILAIKLGVLGVFLGTIISFFSLPFWIEVFILYKDGFKENVSKYYLEYIIRMILTIALAYGMYYVLSLLTGPVVLVFLFKCLMCVLVPNLLFVLVFYRTEEFKYFL
jgi:O-antigen/teichoic acid export membrane protein